MRNLIKQILNCENVVEKCFDLEILRRNSNCSQVSGHDY